jgi:hypothetical protein
MWTTLLCVVLTEASGHLLLVDDTHHILHREGVGVAKEVEGGE